jgi:hypothetical protein
VKRAEGRFPSLTDRITKIAIPGGVEGGSFRNPETAHFFKDLVEELVRSKAALAMYDPDQQVKLASLGRLLCGGNGLYCPIHSHLDYRLICGRPTPFHEDNKISGHASQQSWQG